MAQRYEACALVYVSVEFVDDGTDLDKQAKKEAQRLVAAGLDLELSLIEIHSPGPEPVDD